MNRFIHISEDGKCFSLNTAHQLYQLATDDHGVLFHLYWGAQTNADMRYLLVKADRGFSGNPADVTDDRSYSLDTLPQEYPCAGEGDYRTPALQLCLPDGSASADLRFDSYRVFSGRSPIAGLPAVRPAPETETLEITLRDSVAGIRVLLRYCLWPSEDVITRSAVLINDGTAPLTLCKAASAAIDFPFGPAQVLHFHGRHSMERIPERVTLPHGVSSFGSIRGMSSHHQNPFTVLCSPETGEDQGSCWGVMLMYSGNHLTEWEVDQTGDTRMVAGLHPAQFSWILDPGASFETPEVLLSFSDSGFNSLSAHYHQLIRRWIIPQECRRRSRPVLVNSWEAAYFDISREKLLHLAASARSLGMDTLVVDDGWFGHRDDDATSLGDWTVNEQKIGCTLGELSRELRDMDMNLGLWVEPEMISEDSDLYRAHPDWALAEPNRAPTRGRSQLVLDLSRPEVVEHLFDALCDLLDHAEISYLKWDFNRSVCNWYSHALPANRQGELPHRFMLGTYALLEKLRIRYPGLLIEGCAGGGGRFDAGMLYYCPQIWCSDDTDPIERLTIQRGTSYGYPPCTIGAHVSASPNHQTGRNTPLSTRGAVAMAGTFGYELDPNRLSAEEQEEIKTQIQLFHRYDALLADGAYYRLEARQADWEAWMVVSEDGREALVTAVSTHTRANGPFPLFHLRGLLPDMMYQVNESDLCLSGAALMRGGLPLSQSWGDYPAIQVSLRAMPS